MIFKQTWQGKNCSEGVYFPASVPGNIQADYARAHGFADLQFADNYKQFLPLEDDHWEYRTTLAYTKNEGERVFFVSRGIDYKYDILLDGDLLYSYEGIYRPVELDLTDKLKSESVLTVHIYPHPKRAGAPVGTRDEADASCKPPVCYGWDWNPRLLISGMWQEAYIETRDASYISEPKAVAILNDEMTEGSVTFDFDCAQACEISLYDADGKLVAHTSGREMTVPSPKLWWCNGQGEAYLYRYEIKNAHFSREGRIGFKRLRFLRNEGEGDPKDFPKSRYAPPVTIELNGRKILAKGSNWVNPDVFWGEIDEARYDELLILARDANMNILRLWGGASVCKDSFYDLCDKYGILVWQEFMLACNNYPGTPEYLATLESEASYIIKNLRSHPSLAFWCGGNELFNSWSGMDDQSLPLRLLNKLCYELDPTRPFIPTSPIMGVGHGCYLFYSPMQGGDVFAEFQNAHNTAYTEFGVPSVASLESLKRIIPENELFPIEKTPAWVAHHAFGAWGEANWLCLDVLRRYFGEPKSIEQIVENSSWLQSEGYKGAFEEMRRQWPHCSMMLNWCYNEPWITAANNSIIEYPAKPKKAYFAIKDAMRETIFSARIKKFSWCEGEMLEAEIWLLNDRPEAVKGKVKISLVLGDQTTDLLEWSAEADANRNTAGPTVRFILPHADTDRFTLLLEAEDGRSSSYCFHYRPASAPVKKVKILNM